jgi:hypothetical protein
MAPRSYVARLFSGYDGRVAFNVLNVDMLTIVKFKAEKCINAPGAASKHR